jgi:hypothetical protein
MFALTVYYSFDSEMPVWLFDTKEEAKAELKRQFEEEKRIELDENGNVEDENVVFKMSDDEAWASIINISDGNDSDDVTEWNVSEVRTDAGIGTEFPRPAKDGFMNPPILDENEVVKQIVELLDYSELSAGNISEVFRALHRQGNCIGGKIWSHDDIRCEARDKYEVDLSDDAIAIIADNINGTLDDCHDAEWMAIDEAIRTSDISIKVTDIDWDIDKDDFDEEAEYDAVNGNLPKEVEIPLSELENNLIEEYLSDNYDYCVKSFKTEEVAA